jgi:hypothetical protein
MGAVFASNQKQTPKKYSNLYDIWRLTDEPPKVKLDCENNHNYYRFSHNYLDFSTAFAVEIQNQV